jgi:hypothetical protein
VAPGDWDRGGEDWLVACVPQAVSTDATMIATACRTMCTSVEKVRWRLIPADVTTV